MLTPALLAGLFWLAGGIDWVGGWIWLGAMILGQTASTLIVRRRDPELLRRRAEYGEGTKAWDKVILAAFALSYLAVVVVAALDARLAWVEPMAWWWSWIGVGVYLAGTWLLTRAMSVNTHFEKTVRIQSDRDHQVIEAGPYRHVRHPGYVAAILGFALATPFMLGSWLSLIPAAVVVVVLVVRTALEDRTLRAELDGYADYATRTRDRLVPGVW